jgi:hypothetical protein
VDLTVPGGSFFDWLLHQPGGPPRGGSSTSEPSADDVDAAIDAMRAGHVEFVILDAGDGTFVQAAGEGDGGYQLERWRDGSAVDTEPAASIEQVREWLQGYLAGERPASPSTGAPPEEPSRRRRWFGRG